MKFILTPNRLFLPSILIFWVILISLSLGSCSGTHAPLKDERIKQESVVPTDFHSQATKSTAEDKKLLKNWWTVFHDKKLDALMETLFKDSLDIKAAYLKLKRFYAEYGIAGSNGLNLSINAEKSQSQTTSAMSNEKITTDNYRFSTAASYELDLWGKMESREQAALYLAESAELDLQTLYISLSAQLADLYFVIREKQQKIFLQESLVVTYSKKLDLLRQKYKLGLLEPEILFEIEKTLSNSKATLEGYKRDKRISENALAVLMGSFLPEFTVAAEEKGLIIPKALPVGLPTEVLQQRPDVASSMKILKSYDEQAAAAAADRYPSLNLTASAIYSAVQPEDVFLPTSLVTSIAAGIGASLLDGGRREAELEKRKVMVQEQLVVYRKKVVTAFSEVEGALLKNRFSENRQKHYSYTKKIAGFNLGMVEEKFQNGITDYERLLNAEISHINSQITWVSSIREVIGARIELARALGGNWPEKYMKVENET